MVNELLMKETVAFIEAHPEMWNQDTYVHRTECGTTYCTAGTAALLSGYDFGPNGYSDLKIHEYAMRKLGLSNSQAAEIFFFTYVADYVSTGHCVVRHPTFQELKDKITEVTGVTFNDPILTVAELEEAEKVEVTYDAA